MRSVKVSSKQTLVVDSMREEDKQKSGNRPHPHTTQFADDDKADFQYLFNEPK